MEWVVAGVPFPGGWSEYLFKEIYGGVANSRVSPFHRSEGYPYGIVEVKSGSPLCARGGCAHVKHRGGPNTEEPPSPPGQRREKEATSQRFWI